MTCPPTVALYLPGYAGTLYRVNPVWLWTLRRLAFAHARQALVWMALYALRLQAVTSMAAPRLVVPEPV